MKFGPQSLQGELKTQLEHSFCNADTAPPIKMLLFVSLNPCVFAKGAWFAIEKAFKRLLFKTKCTPFDQHLSAYLALGNATWQHGFDCLFMENKQLAKWYTA